ncbi:hypothetical protein NPIL_57241 [Nephila pilipes]|uniref:Uncharacterized protein n=1 Tax=Nephila pilipes TaxID=299642 RepID=A0A8X6N3N8_NEPPI|nr:hypothetical protein NPIL_57241 [Nephila pilipes]
MLKTPNLVRSPKLSILRRIKKTAHSREYPFKHYAQKRSTPDSIFSKIIQAGSTPSFSRGDKLDTDDKLERPSVSYMDAVSQVLRNPDVQIENQERIRTQ